MKTLIVDDEKHVRDAIKLLIPWQEYGIQEVLEASDGGQAIQLITEHRPEIIFTDMIMPAVPGTELLEWIYKNAPSSKTVVISGHDNFDLVRHTLKHGGMDYLLKPIDAEQLIATLERAVKSWLDDQEKLHLKARKEMEWNQFKPVYLDKSLSTCIQEPSAIHQLLPTLSQDLGMPKETSSCRIGILSTALADQKLMSKFSRQRDLLLYSLINICNELLKQEHLGYAFRYWGGENEIILLLWSQLDNAEKLLHQINRSIFKVFQASFYFGLSDQTAFPSQLKEAYKDAQAALLRRNLLDMEQKICTKANIVKQAANIRFGDKSEMIRLAISSGHADQVRKSLDEHFQLIEALEGITYEQMELWWDEYRLFLTHLVTENGYDLEMDPPFIPPMFREFTLPTDVEGRLQLAQWRKPFEESLLSLSKQLLDRQQKENSIIHEISKYINLNYQHDITLQTIAQHFFLSREYISRKFKQETGENITEYIGRIRIEKAQLLLTNPHIKIAQVAEMVGYEDEKYFSKVFKKLTGLTPNEYRKQQVEQF